MEKVLAQNWKLKREIGIMGERTEIPIFLYQSPLHFVNQQ